MSTEKLVVLGSYPTLAELLESHPVGNIGDAYLVGDEAYVWPESIKAWTNVGVKRWEVE